MKLMTWSFTPLTSKGLYLILCLSLRGSPDTGIGLAPPCSHCCVAVMITEYVHVPGRVCRMKPLYTWVPPAFISALSRTLAREDPSESQSRCLVPGKGKGPHSPEALSVSLSCSVLPLSGAQSVAVASGRPASPAASITHPDMPCPHDSQIPKPCFPWS